jgi:hypothetical protein
VKLFSENIACYPESRRETLAGLERIASFVLGSIPVKPQEVTAVTVELPGGVKAWHYPVPPEDFDPLEADEETLSRYGFPHRPRNQQLLRLWKRALGHPIKILEPRYGIVEGRHRSFAGVTKSWSGGQITSAPGQVFENVIGIWTVPSTYPDPHDGGLSVCSSWIGISDTDGHLLQAGVDNDVDNNNDRSIYAWWTLVPSPEIRVKLPVSAGDSILCAIGARRHPEKDPETPSLLVDIWLANLSRTLGMIIAVQGAPGSYFAATNAEWIVERPSNNPDPNNYQPRGPLANYGQVTFTNCSAVLSGTKTPADLAGGSNIWMTDVNDMYFISEGEIINSSTVLCTWVAYE